MHNIHVTVSYLVYKLVLNRHGYHIVHSDSQYKCTNCHCTMDNVVSRRIPGFCASIIFLWLYYVRTVKTVHNNYIINKKVLTDINIGSYHIAHSDLQYIY